MTNNPRAVAILVLVASSVAFTACAQQRRTSASVATARADGTPPAPPIVQVREFPRSSTISVLSWGPGETSFGLSGRVVRESGNLSGDVRLGDHRLYVSTVHVTDEGGYQHAAVMPGLILKTTKPQVDADHCHRTNQCTPMEFIGVAIPDSVLRANRDSLVVSFSGGAQPKGWNIVLHRDLIAAYLAALDSVRTSLRKGQQ